MKTTKELAEVTKPDRVASFGAVRRMAIRLTARALWQLAGYTIDGFVEAIKAETFTGIGISARPPVGSRADAIVLNVRDAKTPVVVGARDEGTRAAVVGNLAADETAIYNSAALVHVKADGTIEARSKSGAAVPLATKEDLEKLKAAIAGAVTAAGDGGASLKATILGGLATSLGGVSGTAPWPIGTTKLRGE